MENQVSELMKENFIYKSKFNKILESNNDELIKDEEKLDLEIKNIEEEENYYKENLNKFLEERRILNLEMEVLQQESKKINEMEEKYWKIFNQYHEELTEFCENYDTIKRKIINVKENLEILKQTDIFNDTFHIWYDGHFATINGFRLGRLPSQPVDWNEINAAWGQACLLLYTISKKLNFQFSTFKILPLGSYSKIERINDKSSYELYGSNDISLGKIFWYRRFDNGMVAFLQCLNEIIHFIESKDKNFKVPYNIEKDKIGDMSIKVQFNNEEIWTKALKYMLTNMKYILVWLAKQNIS
jgi:beclin 1